MTQTTRNPEYDSVIADHYRKVAESEGLSSSSTMADNITRATETKVILAFVKACLERRIERGLTGPAKIMDVGCGNGYSLGVISDAFPEHEFVGVELTDELRALAITRFEGNDSVQVIAGDLRDAEFSKGHKADVLICQRVLINLLDSDDQNQALKNVISAVDKAQGSLMFMECFDSALARLNSAREEFSLGDIPPAHHNLYLKDDFFAVDGVKPHELTDFNEPESFLSTHFYVTRVLHPMMTRDQPVKRNSEFVDFFSSALAPAAGDYAPLKLKVLDRC